MDSEIMVESLPLLGTCNLCLEEGVVKSMILAHQYKGKTEIYSEMLIKCFSIDVSCNYQCFINSIRVFSFRITI